MNIVVVECTNWMSHVSSTLPFGDGQFLTIRGQHGVGKTALVEAVGYALFGRGRFDAVDEPVRHGANDMSVRVEWIAETGERYRVIRRRTTKAGGKTSLDFAVQRSDGEWTPLNGSSVDRGPDSTEARIHEVVGVDGPTFEAIAFLMQGRITALVEAKAAGRRDVLVGGLLLDRWLKSQTRARKAVTDAEARQATARGLAERMEAAAATLPTVETELEQARLRLVDAQLAAADARTALEAASARRAALLEQAANAERAADDVARLAGERDLAAEEWSRAKKREDDARAQVALLEETLAAEPEIVAAVAALPALRGRVEAHVRTEASERRLQREIADMDRAIRDLQFPHEIAVSQWEIARDAAMAKVDELQAHVDARDSVCPTCGQTINDTAAAAQLAAAQEALRAIGDMPEVSSALDTARAAHARLLEQLASLQWDAAALVADRTELSRLERIAARAEDLARTHADMERAVEAIGVAHADRIRAEERGSAASEQLAAERAKAAEAEPIRDAHAEADRAHSDARLKVDEADANVRSIELAIAAGQAQAATMKAQREEADRLRDELRAGAEAIAIDRRLVDVFGEIPLKIIDASLPELEAEAQSLLDLLDPGSTVAIAGQRASVDGKRVLSAIDITFQDANGRRDVRMTSGGERVAVSVALSLGLRRVLSRQSGAQLRTAVIDEPDGLDAAQRLALVHAIRGLLAAGDLERAALITHHEDLGEAGDLQVVVSKNGHGSEVRLVT